MSDGQVEFIPFEDPRLGRHIRHDERSREFPAPRRMKRPTDIRHRNHSRYKLFQSDIGACTGFTGAQALNTDPYRLARRLKKLPLTTNEHGFEFYGGATHRDPWPGVWPPNDTGSSGLAVAQEMQARGEIVGYHWAFGYDHGLAALPEGPLMQGTWWTEDMFDPDSDGRVRPTGRDVGGHEYLWVGVEVVSRLAPSKNRSWFLNSWEDERNGRYWGVTASGNDGPGGGYFYLEQDDHRALLERDGDLIQLVV